MKSKYCLAIGLIVLILSLNAKNARAENIKIAGSEPMLKIVEILASNYRGTHAGINIEVKGGTSDFGMTELQKTNITIANSARRITPPEILAYLESNRKYIELILAHDNLCVVVHKTNPVKTLTLEQVRQIYAGEIKNWKQVGGNNQIIVLLGRESTSAQASFLKQKIGLIEFDQSMQQMSDDLEVEKLINDPNAIGFVGSAYAKDPSIIAISLTVKAGLVPLDPFDPNVIARGIYPLARKLFQYTTSDKITPAVKEFLYFEFSEAGQAIIEANGVYPASQDEIKSNLMKLNKL